MSSWKKSFNNLRIELVLFNKNLLLDLAMKGLHLVDDIRDYGFPLNRRWDFNPSRIVNNRDR